MSGEQHVLLVQLCYFYGSYSVYASCSRKSRYTYLLRLICAYALLLTNTFFYAELQVSL